VTAPVTAPGTTPGHDPAPYSLRAVEELLGFKRGVVARFIAAGFVTPLRGPRNAYRFSFQDVVLLRTAQALVAAQVPRRRLLASLRALRGRLPKELPLSGLRIQAVGSDVVVSEGGARWRADSGQQVLDFELRPDDGGHVVLLHHRGPAHAQPSDDAPAWHARAEALEAQNPAGAEAAYRAALARDPGHVASLVNLGALLCDTGRCAEAESLLEEGHRRAPDDAAILFNLAIALEDLGRPAEALRRYSQCLAIDRGFADAHFNAARLHEQMGHAREAIRHFNAYRRLMPPGPPDDSSESGA
jgi:tetratricopeptide (TPR) repeat protein